MKSSGVFKFVFAFVLGALIFGGSAALATGIMAQQKTAGLMIDGNSVDLKGYLIDGSHYFQLRDLSEQLAAGGKDFSIAWDSRNNMIVIDTARGYASSDTQTSPIAETGRDTIMYEYAAEVVRLTNIERANAGLPPLEAADDLMEIAMVKSQDMADNHYLSHDSPTFGKTKNLLDCSKWPRFMGENCARGSRTPEAVVKGWMNSEGHRANILNSETSHIGVGVARDNARVLYWTQVFTTAR